MQEAYVPTAVSCTCLNLSFITVSLFPPIHISEEVWHVLSCPEYEEERVNVGHSGWEGGEAKGMGCRESTYRLKQD